MTEMFLVGGALFLLYDYSTKLHKHELEEVSPKDPFVVGKIQNLYRPDTAMRPFFDYNAPGLNMVNTGNKFSKDYVHIADRRQVIRRKQQHPKLDYQLTHRGGFMQPVRVEMANEPDTLQQYQSYHLQNVGPRLIGTGQSVKYAKIPV